MCPVWAVTHVSGRSTPPTVGLREVQDSDLDSLFEFQLDPEACWMAAFTAKDPADREAFEAHWRRLRTDPSLLVLSIECDGAVAGSIGSWVHEDRREVCYWIGREFWGRGVATQALRQLLRDVKTRPIYAAAAKDNVASLRVLEKCGFTRCGESRGFANARGEEIDEVLLILVTP